MKSSRNIFVIDIGYPIGYNQDATTEKEVQTVGVIRFIFWFINILLACKWTVFSIEWLETDKPSRERYWKYVLRRMFHELDDDK